MLVSDSTGDNNIDIGNVGVDSEANTIRIGTQVDVQSNVSGADHAAHTATFIAGINGVDKSSGSPVFIDGNGQLGVGSASSLAGPQGPQGATGPQGVKGDTGAMGSTGPQGAMGATGTQGAMGATGPGRDWSSGNHGRRLGTMARLEQGPWRRTQGAGAARTSRRHRTQGQGDTDSGIKGDTGAAGATGAQGPQGATGTQGVKGDTGGARSEATPRRARASRRHRSNRRARS